MQHISKTSRKYPFQNTVTYQAFHDRTNPVLRKIGLHGMEEKVPTCISINEKVPPVRVHGNKELTD